MIFDCWLLVVGWPARNYSDAKPHVCVMDLYDDKSHHHRHPKRLSQSCHHLPALAASWSGSLATYFSGPLFPLSCSHLDHHRRHYHQCLSPNARLTTETIFVGQKLYVFFASLSKSYGTYFAWAGATRSTPMQIRFVKDVCSEVRVGMSMPTRNPFRKNLKYIE